MLSVDCPTHREPSRNYKLAQIQQCDNLMLLVLLVSWRARIDHDAGMLACDAAD